MLGVEGISQRVAQINRQIAGLSQPAAGGPRGDAAFAAVLGKAVSVGAGPTTPPVKATTSMRNGVPTDLLAYGNGRIPASSLSSINVGNHRLWAPAAQAFQQMSAAAAREGVTLKVTDSYRSYEQQVDVANRKGLYSQGGLAAKPGTSDHGWGLSLDLGLDSKAQTWMRTNGARYGFRENVPREPWHWTYAPPA